MGVILDSSVCIRGERRKITPPDLLRQIHAITGSDRIGLSAIGVTEMVHGIYRADSPARSLYRRTYLDDLLSVLPVYDYTLDTARLAGQIDGEQQAIGNTIPLVDLMIAATALIEGFSIVTVNLRHFRMIPGLHVIPF
jgi:tRNA(fMet)-specific endonuclease VapC